MNAATVAVDVEALKWAIESLANQALDSADEDMALQAVRLHDSLVNAGHGTVVSLVLPDLERLAHL